jgi:hypothetical protein
MNPYLKKEEVMNQEDKILVAQIIAISIEYCFQKVTNQLNYYNWDSKWQYYSDFYKKHHVQDFFKNNLKFLISLKIHEDKSLFNDFLHNTLVASIAGQNEKAKSALLLDPNNSYEVKLDDDIDLYSLNSFIDENILIAIYRYMHHLGKTSKQSSMFKKIITYALSSGIYKHSNGFADLVKNKKSCNLRCNPEDFANVASGILKEDKSYEYLFKFIFKDSLQGVRSVADSLSKDNDFLKEIYNCLSDKDKELFIFSSRGVDLVSASVVFDPDIISRTYERFKEVPFEDYNMRYFLSKHYPQIFNKKLKEMMVKKDREKCAETIVIASKFSGITEKIARYIRSESSEKRAFNVFRRIKDSLFSQANVQKLMTQFADTKHDRLLAEVIKDCPDNLLYLFISNKLVRSKYTWSNNSYQKRSS